MSHRPTSLLLLATALFVLVGCGRRAPQAPQAPPSKKTEPKVEPKVEAPLPKSDEPVRLSVVEPEPAAVTEPWVVGESPKVRESLPVSIPGVAPFAVTGLAVRPAVGRAIVTVKAEPKAKGPKAAPGTRVVQCDTAAGKVITEWVVEGTQAVLDLSPDGRMILAAVPLQSKARSTLLLWQIGGEGQLHRQEWVPHSPITGVPIKTTSGRTLSEAETTQVKWAAFVGNDRIVSASEGGQIRVHQTDGPKLLATIDATPCRPGITPDGSRVAFLAGENVALLDVAGGRVAATRYLGPTGNYPVFAFSPDGKQLAVGGNGKVLLMDMASGAVEHSVLPRLRVNDNGTVEKPFGWAGNKYLYADQLLHDPKFPLPIWSYKGAEQIEIVGTEAWGMVKPPGTFSASLLAFKLPQPGLEERVAAEREKPGLFAMKKGDGIKIDVGGVPAERQGEVRAKLEARIQAAGYTLNPEAPATLVAAVDPNGSAATMSYAGQSKPFVYQKKPATLKLMLNGRLLWTESWATAPPFTLSVPSGMAPADAFAKLNVGAPNYDLFAKAPIPPYIPGPDAPAEAFGSSDFTVTGVKDK